MVGSRRLLSQARAIGLTGIVTTVVALTGVVLAAYGVLPGPGLDPAASRALVAALLSFLLVEVVLLRAAAEEVARRTSRDRVVGLTRGRADTAHEAAGMVRKAVGEQVEEKTILLTSLHRQGAAPDPLAGADPADPDITGLRSAILRKVEEGWALRQVVLVEDRERLEVVIARLSSTPAGMPLRVRVVLGESCGPAALSMLAAGASGVMLVSPDDETFGAGQGVRFDDHEIADWAKHEFDRLWPQATPLWKDGTIDTAGHDTLVALLEAREPPQSSNHGFAEVYGAATTAVQDLARRGQAGEILLANLHGLSGRKAIQPGRHQEAVDAFDDAVLECLGSTGAVVSMRAVYNVDSEARLEFVLDKLGSWPPQARVQVRVLACMDAPPCISPLVVGDRHLFLGTEDTHLYRSGRSLHLRDRDAVQWGKEYFEHIWSLDSLIRIRTPDRALDPAAVDRLRDAIAAFNSGGGAPG